MINEVNRIINGSLNKSLKNYDIKKLEDLLYLTSTEPVEKFVNNTGLVEGMLAHTELVLALELKSRYEEIIKNN